MAFMVTTLIDYGWTESAAAGIITVMSIIVLFIQPFYGYLCDKYMSEKKLTIILLSLSALLFFLLPFSLNSGNRTLVILNMIGITVTGVQVAGILDAWIVGLKQEIKTINYGLIRGTGSFAYALSAQITGIITISFGHNARLWFGCGFFIIAVFAAISFRSSRRSGQTSAEKNPVNKPEELKQEQQKLKGLEAIKLIFSSKQYCLLLTVSFFLLLSNIAMTILIQLVIRNFGGTTAHIGTATAVMAVSEVPLMFLMAVIMKKFKFNKILIFCSIAYVIRMLFTAYAGTVNSMIFVQLFQGITYAVLIPLSMSYLSVILDERVRSTAVTTYTAVTVSLTSIIGNFITTTLLATGFTAQTALIVFSVSSLIGLFFAIFGVIRKIW